MSKPLENHWVAAKGVLRYIQGTLDFGIIYTNSFDIILTYFSDSNWAGNMDDIQSIADYAFNIGSGVIAWSSKNLNTISLSSAEVKYQAMCRNYTNICISMDSIRSSNVLKLDTKSFYK